MKFRVILFVLLSLPLFMWGGYATYRNYILDSDKVVYIGTLNTNGEPLACIECPSSFQVEIVDRGVVKTFDSKLNMLSLTYELKSEQLAKIIGIANGCNGWTSTNYLTYELSNDELITVEFKTH